MCIGINSLECLTLAEEQANLTEAIMLDDIELQHLSIKAGYLYQEYTKLLEEEALDADIEVDTSIDTTEEKNWEAFEREFEVAQVRLDNQEKQIEMDKTNKQTKLTEVTNLLESAEKRRDKNIESGMKGVEQ